MEDSDMARRKQIMDVLSEFLHNSKRTVEQLWEGHTFASMQASKQRRASAFGMPSALDKGLQHDPLAYQSLCRPDHQQHWPFASPSNTINERFPERRSDASSDAMGIGFWRFSESEMDRAIAVFLNDMRKTVDTWCVRCRLLAEGKGSIEGMPQPMQSDMQVPGQLGFEPDAGHNFSLIASMDDRDNEVLLPNAQSRQIIAQPFVKTALPAARRGKRKLPTVRPNRKRSRASGSSSQAVPDGTNSGHNLEMSQQDMAVGQKLDSTEVPPEGTGGNGHLRSMASDNDPAESANLKLTSLDPDKKAAADIDSPVQTDELTIRPHHYKIEVVENPPWLPQGWITELKTRSTGGSAGCKDKYYYDPVSKRRCRSQKEVFCFLETGKLGRYKRKQLPANKVLALDLEQQQVANASEMQTAEKDGVPGIKSAPQNCSQEGTPGTLGIFPGGAQRSLGGSTFLPYQPGQTADILYDSLTNLSRPGFGMDQYRYMDPIKSSGDKSLNPSRPWFLAHPEMSTGAFIDGAGINVPERNQRQGVGRGRRSGEAAPKRARKSTKKAAT